MSPEVILHIEPGIVKSWDHFRSQHPPYSISLDGYVDGPPAFDPTGPYANFDHHFGVNRLATRSTSGQVLVAIGLGLFDTFQRGDRGFANVYVNDCDQDVCLAYWLLCNAELVNGFRIDMDIAKLIIAEDFLDTTAGAYPIDLTTSGMRTLAWVFDAYNQARTSGQLSSMHGEDMRRLIEETSSRITALAQGNPEETKVIGEYEQIGGGSGWKMIREHGAFARTELFYEGCRAFVSVRERHDGRFDYTVGRMSPFVNFPMDKIFMHLNEAEGTMSESDKWGGSDTVGGSPRRLGSQLPPATVARLVESTLQVSR